MLYLKLQKLEEYPKMIDKKLIINKLLTNLITFNDQIYVLIKIG
jgi:hypothetical protein